MEVGQNTSRKAIGGQPVPCLKQGGGCREQNDA